MKAAIDIGTNTVLLLIAEIEAGQIRVIREEHRSPRLGQGVDGDRNINKEATERVVQALKDYRQILDDEYPGVKDAIVTATSAVRDANNCEDFIQVVKVETCFDIRLLSGREEAEWTAAGALSVLPISDEKRVMILDIGGGSTEVAHLQDGRITDGYSFDMGSVRFTERFLSSNPPTVPEIEVCREAVSNLYDSHTFEYSESVKAVGVAGTLTTLAGMALNLSSYEPEKINGFSITDEIIEHAIKQFKAHTYEVMLEKHPLYLKGRADIFMAGLLILEGFMKKFEVSEIEVSTGGIRHGAILKA
ncbi:Ppx/GppA family phosphatase [Gracilimonas sp.]|uniref:Ppx/GppA phosphatase family protein n=1 Tax=Gracilimonas sp. TaxID=1974203 RepID=UPI0028725BFA|nr:Ppx/GppA phosphatase family protein [Gracilimonas sp.]